MLETAPAMTIHVFVVPALSTGRELQLLLKDGVSKHGLGLKNHSTGILQRTPRTVRAVEKPRVRGQCSSGDRELLPGQADYLCSHKVHATAHSTIKDP